MALGFPSMRRILITLAWLTICPSFPCPYRAGRRRRLQGYAVSKSADSSPRPVYSAGHSQARLIRFALTVTLILLALHGYIGMQLLPDMLLNPAGWTISLGLLSGSALLIPLGMLARFFIVRPSLADGVSWAGSLAMGLFSSLLVLTLLRQIALLLSDIPQRDMVIVEISAWLVPALALLITLVGFVNARRVARVVKVDIPLAGLPPALAGFTIVQLSDIHVGATIKGAYVRAVVARANKLNADLVAITGDVVDGSVEQLAVHAGELAHLSSRHGTFLVTGNHEYYAGAAAWVDEFRRIGLCVLMNEHVLLQHNGALLAVAGVTDYSAHQFDPDQQSNPHQAIAGVPEGIPRVLLAHQPRSNIAAAAAGFDLQLSGHTHGGQFWPWNLFVCLQQPYTAGLHRLNHLWVYISRGTGYWGPPKRFGAPSEITYIRLVAESGLPAASDHDQAT